MRSETGWREASMPTVSVVKPCLVLFAVASALYVSWPALSWSFKGRLGQAKSPCVPCVCHCPPPLSLDAIAPGLVNLSITDCGKQNPELNKEMEKDFSDLVGEELQLQEAVMDEHKRRMNLTIVEARSSAYQYQAEAEKCNAATENCEEARERAETSLRKERKRTALWEKRARQLGWL